MMMTGSRAQRASSLVAVLSLLALTPVGAAPSRAGTSVAVAGSNPAIVTGGRWFLRDSLTTGPATNTFRYGVAWDMPVMGDWNDDGHDTAGVARITGLSGPTPKLTWYLRNSNSTGVADLPPFEFGDVRFVAFDQLGTIPLVGDWDGDGIDTVGVLLYDFELDGPMQWQLRNSNTPGPPDVVLTYGQGRSTPLVGDWDGDGDDTVGLHVRLQTWQLRNANTSGPPQVTFLYGSSRYLELPLVGDWDGNGTDTPALLRNRPPTDPEGGFETWLFRNSNTTGVADGQIVYGNDAHTISHPIDTIPRLAWK
jgi:hypothetical protein